MRNHLKRQSFLGIDSDEKLKDSVVAIIGLCGGGSHIAQQLAHIGVGNFRLFDDDYVEEHNRNRMVGLDFEFVNRSAPKVDVIESLIHRINPEAVVQKNSMKWQEGINHLKDCTFIFGCVDSYRDRDELERFSRRYLIPYIDVGMDVHGEEGSYFITGQVILSLPGHLCMRCLGFISDKLLAEEAGHYGKAGGRPQVIWPNGVLTSTAVGKFMQLVTPWHKDFVPPIRTDYDGNRNLLYTNRAIEALTSKTCRHFDGPNDLGDVL